MPHPILPPLRPGNQVANFAAPGTWEPRAWDQAKMLYEGLNVEEMEFSVNAIPDLWARPILFEMALFDEMRDATQSPRPLHQASVGEWRGLLAILALREWRGWRDISVAPVFTGDPGTWPDFLRVAQRLAPQSSLSAGTLWTDVQVILMRGQPIALLSPTTLVCTAAECRDRISADVVPWFDEKTARLGDPLLHLASNERRGLAAWVGRLLANLAAHQGLHHNGVEWQRINALLTRFNADLLRNIAPGNTPYLNSPTGLPLQTGIFVHLAAALRARDNDTTSHIRVVSGPGRAAARLDYLCVDERVARSWGYAASEILAWGDVPLSAALAPATKNGPRDRIAGRVLNGAEWFPAAEVFSDRLCIVRQRNALVGALRCDGDSGLMDRGGQPVTPLLPVAKRLLDYYTAEEIADRTSFESVSDGIKVAFRLTLTGPSLAGQEFIVEETYFYPKEKKDQSKLEASRRSIVEMDELPVVEIWPNFQAPDWRAYYLYYSTGGVQKMFRVQPYGGGSVARKHSGFEITLLDRFPEALLCTAPGPGGVEAYAGIIPLPAPLHVRGAAGRVQSVGLDFGTTGTRILTREGGGAPQPVIFKQRSHQVTDSVLRTAMYREFFPSLEENTESLLSLFHDFGRIEGDQRHVLDGHVNFIRDYSDFNATSKDIAKNMKWGDMRERKLARLFLRQLCLQTTAEAVSAGVGAIDWRFSFPGSFSGDDRHAFRAVWQDIIRGCEHDTGVAQTLGPRNDESTAAARFFAHRMGAPLDRGTVTIDIGGGTSDIAVWQDENRLRCHASVKLAGRDIFLYPLYIWPEFLQKYFRSIQTDTLVRAAKDQMQDAFYAQADAVLKAFGPTLLEQLPAAEAEPKVREFLRLVETGLSGLFYYVGLTLRALHEAGNYKPQMPNVYLGGNGAKLLLWCTRGRFDADSPTVVRLGKILKRATGFNSAPFEVQLSELPKAEVAYGLLIDEQFMDVPAPEDGEEPPAGVIAGENFSHDGQEKGWGHPLSAAMVHKGVRVGAALTNFESFVAALPPGAAGAPNRLTPELKQRILDGVNGELINTKGASISSIRLNPLFILALRVYLQEEAKRWGGAEKNQTAGGPER